MHINKKEVINFFNIPVTPLDINLALLYGNISINFFIKCFYSRITLFEDPIYDLYDSDLITDDNE